MNIISIPKIPIVAAHNKNQEKKDSNYYQENNIQFKDILRQQFDTSEKTADTKISKLQKIKERLATNYYKNTDVSELIAEKLMNGWT
ncbi:MAG TPA: hypothetical protein PLM75_13655 [bacterium]|nr:hypothetical protein [bacterium]HPP88894.1 hypothetical protein [bacterium]